MASQGGPTKPDIAGGLRRDAATNGSNGPGRRGNAR